MGDPQEPPIHLMVNHYLFMIKLIQLLQLNCAASWFEWNPTRGPVDISRSRGAVQKMGAGMSNLLDRFQEVAEAVGCPGFPGWLGGKCLKSVARGCLHKHDLHD